MPTNPFEPPKEVNELPMWARPKGPQWFAAITALVLIGIAAGATYLLVVWAIAGF
jgi:hypothetical protein